MDYGIAVSQKGKDAKSTADRFFTISSAFQSLKVLEVHSVTTTIPTAGNTNTITITHNLGYYAPAIVIYNGSTSLGQGTSYFMSDSAFFTLDVEIGLNTIKINVNEGFDDQSSVVGDTVYFTVYSFIDTFDSFTAPVLSTDTTDQSDAQDYGLRISKPGFDVKTCADVDCIISSSFYTTTVHKRGTDNTGTITHDLGYIPGYLAYRKFSGDDFLYLEGGGSVYGIVSSINATEMNWTDTGGDTLYYVIFKSKIV